MLCLWFDVSFFRLSVSEPDTISFDNAEGIQLASQQLVLQVLV